MGLVQSRLNNRSPESDQGNNNIYKYPPKSGYYFGSHFYMGSEKFETMRPDVFLLGENDDLNFLANKLFSYSFSPPQTNEPIKTLKSLINIRKDSLKFVKINDENPNDECRTNNNILTLPPPPPPPPPPLPLAPPPPSSLPPSTNNDIQPAATTTTTSSATTTPLTTTTTTTIGRTPDIITTTMTASASSQQQQQTTSTTYNIEFTFDSDVKCAITIYYFATEDFVDKQVIYKPSDPKMNSETFHYKRGSNQVFSQTTHIVDPSKFPDSQWQYDPVKEIIPIVIQCDAEDEEHVGHSHILYAVVDRVVDGSFVLRPLKQKQMMNGLCYLLQEIYGIENKNTESAKPDDDIDDNGSECIICMCEPRDTVILPCRHLCLCNGCADNLRYQANNCPICRAKFRALLQIRAIQKKKPGSRQQRDVGSGDTTSAAAAAAVAAANQEGVPPGYEAVSLVEALNGPTLPHRARQVVTNLHKDQTAQSIYVNIEGVVGSGSGGGGGASSSCGGSRSDAAAPKPQHQHHQHQQQHHQQQSTKVVNKRTTAVNSTESVDFATTSSSSSTSRNTISPSLSTVGEKFDGDDDDDDDYDDGGDSRAKSNQDDLTSSSAHVVNSLTEDGAGTGGDGSSFQQASMRSSVANTSMDSETADIKYIDSQMEGCSNHLKTSTVSNHPLSNSYQDEAELGTP